MKKVKKCERCGGEFACGVGSKKICWCFHHDLTEETQAKIREKYQDCLCPVCLEYFQKEQKNE
ncbi:MAG: cysteine-rich CWC family protein [Candidatus Omnitrophica bacterium]|nr:cysteine-rich CWC family protein [Candidatus Omnitrophota bacterium]